MNRPLISFSVFAFSQERFVREAVKGAFSQTYSPLEIILSDDCSQDRTFEIMKEMAAEYKGPHKVRINRNEKNLGIGGHVNRIMELAQGELIIPSGGDDISVPERTQRLYGVWKDSRFKAKSIFSNMRVIDEDGRSLGPWAPSGYRPRLAVEDMVRTGIVPLFGCSHAWDRDVFSRFGPMITPLVHEDMVIPLRSVLIGKIEYVDEILVYYRRHSTNAWKETESLSDLKTLLKNRKAKSSHLAMVYRNWISDISKARLFPETSRRFEPAITIAAKRLERIDTELDLFEARPSLRVRQIARAVLSHRDIKAALRWAGMFLMPRLYLYYLKLRRLLSD